MVRWPPGADDPGRSDATVTIDSDGPGARPAVTLLKVAADRVDEIPVTARADVPDWTQSEVPLRMRLDGSADFSGLTDQQLLEERQAQQHQLDELVVGPDSSPAVEQIQSTIQRELGDLSAEMTRRGLIGGRAPQRSGHRLRIRR